VFEWAVFFVFALRVLENKIFMCFGVVKENWVKMRKKAVKTVSLLKKQVWKKFSFQN